MAPCTKGALAAVFLLSAGTALSGCNSAGPANRTLYSARQPVVERGSYALDLRAGTGGLTAPERQRLAGWFAAMDVGYGDRIAVSDPAGGGAVARDVAALAGRYGLTLSEAMPASATTIEPGMVRVTVMRSSAHVPGCPDWSDDDSAHYSNETARNFGCATNANLAAMVADPEDLIRGAEDPDSTRIMTSNKAIAAYRNQAATGATANEDLNFLKNGSASATTEED
ncbi:pilus assembly protein CpaD [Altericroceibacterium spongiae]|uniref:Pilus assembly protein CpaD n=1 Tax=Altericroceibacterium spongiae TaxID=2320269 RepID=A0A420EK64_9SPHN|nr:CpaD family pilus assembly protein [Altericroceibacterium spongiae]RKF21121.1 pilus assembly protein CpaD [Altericroceibacterium spongiae]